MLSDFFIIIILSHSLSQIQNYSFFKCTLMCFTSTIKIQQIANVGTCYFKGLNMFSCHLPKKLLLFFFKSKVHLIYLYLKFAITNSWQFLYLCNVQIVVYCRNTKQIQHVLFDFKINCAVCFKKTCRSIVHMYIWKTICHS